MLSGMMKQCELCSKNFTITASDQAFYVKIKVPAPRLCPDCRMQRRLAWRNERFYYHRTCSKTGKQIISIYSPAGPVKQVYDNAAWFSDDWDALDHGQDIDWSRPFFEQFFELYYKVPQINLWRWECENADYNNCCMQLKNSYMNASTDRSEESYYSYVSLKNRSVADCTALENSELAIECIDSDQLYHSAYCQQCRNCLEAYASFDCIGCKYIFGCTGLRHKEYYMFNKPVTPEEWQRRLPKLLQSYKGFTDAQNRAYKLSLAVPRLYNSIYNSENCTGNYIWNCKNAKMSFDARHGENIKYCWYAPWDLKDSMDGYANGGAELLYDANYGTPAYNAQFVLWLKDISNSQYCILCVNGCQDLFGCVGLKKKQFCIFNKQYTKTEYHELRDKLITHMKETGEYGELFPAKYSPFGYNETVAQEYFPLSQADAERLGWPWRTNTGGTYGKETLVEIPDRLAATNDEITKAILKCVTCTKNYQIIGQELALYRHVQLPLPRQCPNCRHLRRIQLRNPRRLWQRQCMCTQPNHHHSGRCAAEFETSYAPDRKELVYCQQCYQATIL